MEQLTDNQSARVFFALWPTAVEGEQLGSWQKSLMSLTGGRPMRRETLHATLAFIGEVDSAKLGTLQLAAREVATEDFMLCFDEVRYWGHNHIIYAAPSHSPQKLAQLVDALERSLNKHHCKFDRREYQPHVTLLRNAPWGDDAALPVMQPVCWQIRDFALVQSVRQHGLSGYRVLARFPLARRSE
jgi:2'-5' RNA ligase